MKQGSVKVFITDCEGPVTRNDNAAELAEAFIPQGDRFFAKISLYDDYLAEVVRRPGYKAGDTLRLILPFFKAFGLDDRTMVEFSGRGIAMIPSADLVLKDLLRQLPCYIVSTSYSPYVRAVCDAIGFPFENCYCTSVSLDAYTLPNVERNALKEIHASIMSLPDFTIPSVAQSPTDLVEEDKKTVAALDEIFWTELPRLGIYGIVHDVNPVGGREKAKSIEDIVIRERTGLRDVIYVGDSITDVDAFRLVKNGGGLAVSFNGNDWAVREAEFAITARNAFPIGWVATLFAEKGLEAFEDLMMDRPTAETVSAVSTRSSRVRKGVRTEKIGSLG
jgi:energy-converting hydrogenase A subunit R